MYALALALSLTGQERNHCPLLLINSSYELELVRRAITSFQVHAHILNHVRVLTLEIKFSKKNIHFFSPQKNFWWR